MKNLIFTTFIARENAPDGFVNDLMWVYAECRPQGRWRTHFNILTLKGKKRQQISSGKPLFLSLVTDRWRHFLLDLLQWNIFIILCCFHFDSFITVHIIIFEYTDSDMWKGVDYGLVLKYKAFNLRCPTWKPLPHLRRFLFLLLSWSLKKKIHLCILFSLRPFGVACTLDILFYIIITTFSIEPSSGFSKLMACINICLCIYCICIWFYEMSFFVKS